MAAGGLVSAQQHEIREKIEFSGVFPTSVRYRKPVDVPFLEVFKAQLDGA